MENVTNQVTDFLRQFRIGEDFGTDVLVRIQTIYCRMNGNDWPEPIILAPGEVRTQLGTVSQFTGEKDSSACTSIAQCFLRYLFLLGKDFCFRPEVIDSIVSIGKENYKVLMEKVKEEAKVAGVSVSECLGHDDSKDLYGLENLRGFSGKTLKAQNDSTEAFFLEELKLLERFTNEHSRIGGIIHAKNYTFALALIKKDEKIEYLLFDSHGCEALNQKKEAFITLTNSREKMAKVLSTLIPYAKTSQEVAVLLTQEELKRMEEDNNSYILYVVKPKGSRQIFPQKDRSLWNDKMVQLVAFCLFLTIITMIYRRSTALKKHFIKIGRIDSVSPPVLK